MIQAYTKADKRGHIGPLLFMNISFLTDSNHFLRMEGFIKGSFIHESQP